MLSLGKAEACSEEEKPRDGRDDDINGVVTPCQDKDEHLQRHNRPGDGRVYTEQDCRHGHHHDCVAAEHEIVAMALKEMDQCRPVAHAGVILLCGRGDSERSGHHAGEEQRTGQAGNVGQEHQAVTANENQQHRCGGQEGIQPPSTAVQVRKDPVPNIKDGYVAMGCLVVCFACHVEEAGVNDVQHEENPQ